MYGNERRSALEKLNRFKRKLANIQRRYRRRQFDELLRFALRLPSATAPRTDRRKARLSDAVGRIGFGIIFHMFRLDEELNWKPKGNRFHDGNRRTSYAELRQLTGCSDQQIKDALRKLNELGIIDRECLRERIGTAPRTFKSELWLKPNPWKIASIVKEMESAKEDRKDEPEPKTAFKLAPCVDSYGAEEEGEEAAENRFYLWLIRWTNSRFCLGKLYLKLNYGEAVPRNDKRKTRIPEGFNRFVLALIGNVFSTRADATWGHHAERFDGFGYRCTSLEELRHISNCTERELRDARELLESHEILQSRQTDSQGRLTKALWLRLNGQRLLESLSRLPGFEADQLIRIIVARRSPGEENAGILTVDLNTRPSLIICPIFYAAGESAEASRLLSVEKKDGVAAIFFPFTHPAAHPGRQLGEIGPHRWVPPHLLPFTRLIHSRRGRGEKWAGKYGQVKPVDAQPGLVKLVHDSSNNLVVLTSMSVAFVAARLRNEFDPCERRDMTWKDVKAIDRLVRGRRNILQEVDDYLGFRAEANKCDWRTTCDLDFLLSNWKVVVEREDEASEETDEQWSLMAITAEADTWCRDFEGTENTLRATQRGNVPARCPPAIAAVIQQPDLAEIPGEKVRDLRMLLEQRPELLIMRHNLPLAGWAKLTNQEFSRLYKMALKRYEEYGKYWEGPPCPDRVEDASGSATIPTPWPGLNSAFGGGLFAGQTSLLLGYTGRGKTVFCCQLAAHVAQKGVNVLLVLPEASQSASDLCPRFISNLANVCYTDILWQPDIVDLPSSVKDCIVFEDFSNKQVLKDWRGVINRHIIERVPQLVIVDGLLDAATRESWTRKSLDGVAAIQLLSASARMHQFSLLITSHLSDKAINSPRITNEMIRECPRLLDFVENAIAISARQPVGESAECWSQTQLFRILKLRGEPTDVSIPVRCEFQFQRFVECRLSR